MLCTDLNATLHNCPLPENHVKVRVDLAIEGDAPLPVPLEYADIFTVEQAVGTFVAWPLLLVKTVHVSVMLFLLINMIDYIMSIIHLISVMIFTITNQLMYCNEKFIGTQEIQSQSQEHRQI